MGCKALGEFFSANSISMKFGKLLRLRSRYQKITTLAVSEQESAPGEIAGQLPTRDVCILRSREASAWDVVGTLRLIFPSLLFLPFDPLHLILL